MHRMSTEQEIIRIGKALEKIVGEDNPVSWGCVLLSFEGVILINAHPFFLF